MIFSGYISEKYIKEVVTMHREPMITYRLGTPFQPYSVGQSSQRTVDTDLDMSMTYYSLIEDQASIETSCGKRGVISALDSSE